ncbi:GntR family transcriptional regulator [Flexivirga caeni]|nr:GntR family transcriptional regulator [Flexivirga caeni]
MPDPVQPLHKGLLREDITNALRAAIISGGLLPGVLYSAPSLAERFGVSATPVREAMLDLVREGLVVTVRNKGYRVTEIGDEQLDEITELRLLVEPPLVARATPKVPAADFPKLRSMADAIVRGAERGDLIDYTESDRMFHLRLLEYAGNRRATTLISELRAHTRLYGLNAITADGQLVESAAEHHAILDAMEQRDKRLVTRLMKRHIAQTRGRWAGHAPGEIPGHAPADGRGGE